MLDTSTKLQLLAERFKSKSESMYINSIKEALSSVIAKLAKTEGQSEIKRLNSIKRFIEEEIGTLYESIKPTLAEDMQGFAKVQHEVMFNGLNSETGAGYAFVALPKETIKEIINMDSIILMNDKGYTLNEMFATASNAQIDRYKQIISAGLAENAGYSAITKRLKDANAVGTTTLQAIVHTAVSSARDKANVNVYKKFDKYIDYFESTAVLDSRTSPICSSLDGEIYRMPYDNIPNRPPRHWNSVAKGEKVLTSKGYKPIEDIKAGDYVYTHKGRFRRVLNTMYKSCDNGIIRVITNNFGVTIRVTDEHPLLVSSIGWVQAGQVKVGDELCYNGKDISNIKIPVSSNILYPENYPPIFISDFIDYKLLSSSFFVTMPSTITLNEYFGRWYSKINNSISKNILVNKIKSIVCEKFQNLKFGRSNIFSKIFSQRINNFSFSKSVMHWVIRFHSLRVSLVNFAIFLVHSVRPVIKPSSNAKFGVSFSNNTTNFRLTDSLNAMFLTPLANSSVRKIKLSFNLSKRFFKPMIMLLNKIKSKIPVFKVEHFYSSNISDISIVAYNDIVYNIEVEEDNSYLVNGIVVHNCRSVLVGRSDSFKTNATRQQNGDTKGQISSNVKFPEWFGKQSSQFQLDYLGKARYDLYKSGKMEFRQFVDVKSGKLFTLDDIDNIMKR